MDTADITATEPRTAAILDERSPSLSFQGSIGRRRERARWNVLIELNGCPMPRYYFNIIAGDGFRQDLEGTELPSLEDAKAEAIEDARALMSDAILLGQDISSRRLEICNEAGDVLLTVLFKDAIKPVA
ncbi:DUF6894 family protein [Rhizobium leguminosarum]|nr:hypothetical protein [Rhizobium leguminosarum]